MAEEAEEPKEEEKEVVPAPDGMRNCSVCGMWLRPGSWHNHEKEEDRDYP